EAGANDYLVKPYRTAELLAKVAVLLRERKFLRQPSEPALPLPPDHVDTETEAGAAGRADTPVDADQTQSGSADTPVALPHYFFDQYVVSGEYGRGGMGTVYRAVRREDGIDVALKVLAPRLS